MKKKLWALVLALGLCLGLALPASAAEEVPMMEPSVETSLNNRDGRQNCVLKSNGELWAYEVTVDDTIRSERMMSDVLAVSLCTSQQYQLLVLQTDGTLWRCGFEFGEGLSEPVYIASDVRQIGLSSFLTADGTLYSYAAENYRFDELGYMRWDYVSTEIAHNVIRMADGKTYITSDHVLHYDYLDSTRKMDGFSAVKGRGTYFAVSDDGDLYAWGDNSFGQVGSGNGFDYTHYNNLGNYYIAIVDGPVKVLDDVGDLSCVTVVYNEWMKTYQQNQNELCVYVLDDAGTLWQWGDAPKRTTRISGEEAVLADAQYCTPRKSGTAQPVYTNLFDFTVGEDGYLYTRGTNYTISGERYKLPVKLSEVMGVGESEAPVGPAAPAEPGGFTDVPAGAYYYDSVQWAVEEEITQGKTADTFAPGEVCTRAQIITFLWRAAGCPEPEIEGAAFFDTDPHAYYYKAALWAWEEGVVDTDIRPGDPCTREAAVEFMWKYAGSPDAPAADFADVSSGAVDWALDAGVTQGKTGNTFAPADSCTRGQIVTFLYRAFAE